MRPSANKLLNADGQPVTKDWWAALRVTSRSVVFTNGCFRCFLHYGHVVCLTEAAEQGDVLVVAVNSDASLKKLRRESLQNQTYRALTVAALGCVDYVVLFDEETPARLISQVGPNVLVKGGDYRGQELAGEADVLARGGRVHLTRYVEGISTTRLLAVG